VGKEIGKGAVSKQDGNEANGGEEVNSTAGAENVSGNP